VSGQGPRLTALQQLAAVALRVVVGWHFLYEGYSKFAIKNWSAQGFLEDARGPLAGVFQHLAAGPRTLEAINLLNVWGLTLVGACLILGLATRFSCLCAMAMLALYYLANPPWLGVLHRPGEGSYLYVDKNVVEFAAVLLLLVLNTGRIAGLDVLVLDWRRRRRMRSGEDADA
jgi:thiosulfate dehydrogenase [quinone] large subunit